MIRAIRRFWASEDASSTIEFVLLFPGVFVLLLSSFELGLLLTRQVMLDRAIDLAVREVRLGHLNGVTHDSLKTLICRMSLMIPDCTNQLRLEMLPADPRAWSTLPTQVSCVDRSDPSQPVVNFTPGASNELVVLRVCALFDPYFPNTGLGFHLHRAEGGDAYALVSSSAYVVEP